MSDIETSEQQVSDKRQPKMTLETSTYFTCSRMNSIIATHRCEYYRNIKRYPCDNCAKPDYERDPSTIIDIKQHLADNPAKPKIEQAQHLYEWFLP